MDRLLKGVAFIEENLGDKIDVTEVAQAAHYSTYHFCRLFHITTGETVMGYVRKRRLTVAAEALMMGADDRLIELAVDAGFESQAAFTRAFKAHFGVTPGGVRTSERTWLPRRRFPIDERDLIHSREMITMKPKFIERGDIYIAYLADRVGNDGGNSDGTSTWKRFHPVVGEITCRRGQHAFGVVEVIDKKAGVFSYSAAVEIDPSGDILDKFETKTLMGGRFAVFSHKLASPDIGSELKQTFRYIYGTWLPKSAESLRAYYDLEYYDARFDSKTLSGEVDIWVPVK